MDTLQSMLNQQSYFSKPNFLLYVKKNRELRDFSYLKVRSNFC